MKKSRLHRFSTHDGVIGAVVLLVVVALLGTLAVIYLRPPGQKSITFEVTDASAIEPGEDVRVAGISVGKVSEVTLAPGSTRRPSSATRPASRSGCSPRSAATRSR